MSLFKNILVCIVNVRTGTYCISAANPVSFYVKPSKSLIWPNWSITFKANFLICVAWPNPNCLLGMMLVHSLSNKSCLSDHNCHIFSYFRKTTTMNSNCVETYFEIHLVDLCFLGTPALQGSYFLQSHWKILKKSLELRN